MSLLGSLLFFGLFLLVLVLAAKMLLGAPRTGLLALLAGYGLLRLPRRALPMLGLVGMLCLGGCSGFLSAVGSLAACIGRNVPSAIQVKVGGTAGTGGALVSGTWESELDALAGSALQDVVCEVNSEAGGSLTSPSGGTAAISTGPGNLARPLLSSPAEGAAPLPSLSLRQERAQSWIKRVCLGGVCRVPKVR